MQPHNVPQFVQLLKERKFPIEGMRMEVITDTPKGKQGFKGIITLAEDDTFSLSWCRWECLLLLMAHFEWKYILVHFLPYCLGWRTMNRFDVNSDMGRKLEVIRAIK